MQSKPVQTPANPPENQNPRAGRRLWAVPLILCAAILAAGGVLAKYVYSNRQRAEMESAQFHISSNYLEEGGTAAPYVVADWGDGFDILLYNYEKENIAQVSGVEITYGVEAEKAAVEVRGREGGAVAPGADGSYSFPAGDSTACQLLHVTPNPDSGAGDRITVTVQTAAPYQKTLTAAFQIQRNQKPDYTARDQGDGTVLVTVATNDYADTIMVTWNPDKYSPDNTNALMAAWVDTNPTGTFKVDSNSTYELLFFKNTGAEYTETHGTGTTIELK